jgi:hypothetical protein
MQSVPSMYKICKCEMPLLVMNDTNGQTRRILSTNNMTQKEKVQFELVKNSAIGLINTYNPKTELRKIYCYSHSGVHNLNFITSYMGYEFNGKVYVKKENQNLDLSNDNKENIDETYEFMHISEVINGLHFTNKILKNGLLHKVTEDLIEYHKENTKMYDLKQLNLAEVCKMYSHLLNVSNK